MVFNWFRRQNNDPKTSFEDKQPETPPSKESQPETPSNDETEATTDLLAFAKAAYKNIQQKQPSAEGEISLEVTDVSAEVPEQVETPQIEESVVIDETTADEPDAEELPDQTIAEEPDAESIETTPTEQVATPEDTQPKAPATLSFLERAAAERQAKQERLIANAIEVSEPPAATLDVAEEIPGFAFDDGFVWSTEVLAAQGRRAEDVSIEEINWLKKLRQGLDKTRRGIVNQLKAIVGQGPLNQAAVDEIESLLLQADVGVEATDHIIKALQKQLTEEVTPPEQAIAFLKTILRDMLDAPLKASDKPGFTPDKENLNIWLITGVNGAGKTTTIGKIAHLAQKSGYKCLIGAADTFRAAAVEQVKVWGSRSGVEVIANTGKNTDPAAVVFDAIVAAQSRETELLLVDTAGRLQNKKNLMDELSKIRRIIDKKAPNAKVESLLVLDATLGQNGLRQAEVFSQAAQLSGIVLTKLDGTAKGGVALAVVQQLGLPIRFIGAGEGIEDLRPFSSYEFVEALLSS